MKSLIASILILGLVGMVVGVAVQGAETSDVAATVTPKLVSVLVTDGAVAYGTIDLSSSANTVGTDTQTAANDGNVTENFNIRSSDAIATGTDSNWELVTAATGVGANTYRHEYSTDSGTTWLEFDIDNVTYTSLATSVAAGDSQTFDLQIYTPSSTTGYGERAITVTVQATE